MKQTLVSIVRGDDVQKQVTEAIRLIGGMEHFVKPGMSVLLKPNLTGPALYHTGVTTNPAVVEALVILLKEAGVTDITIGDGTGSIHIGTLKILEDCGFGDIARRYNTKLLDLNKGEVVNLPVAKPYILEKIKVTAACLDFDAIINIPVLKTHFITEVSLGMKNLKGCIPPSEMRLMHEVGVNKAVADLSTVLRTTLTVVDGTVASEGLGPKEGTPVGFKTVLAGEDILAVDAVSAHIMGFDPQKIEHFRLAYQRGVGVLDLSDITVVGEKPADVRREFLPAIPTIPDSDSVSIINGSACSGCIGCAVISISRLEDSGLLDRLKEKGIKLSLAIGSQLRKQKKWQGNTFVVGNCAKAYQNKGEFLPGCAPAAIDVAEMVLSYYDIKERPQV